MENPKCFTRRGKDSGWRIGMPKLQWKCQRQIWEMFGRDDDARWHLLGCLIWCPPKINHQLWSCAQKAQIIVCMCWEGEQLFQSCFYTLRLKTPRFYKWLQIWKNQSNHVPEYILMLKAHSFYLQAGKFLGGDITWFYWWYHLIWPNWLSYLGFSRWTNCASSSPLSTQRWPDCVSLELADTDISNTFPDSDAADDRHSVNKMFPPKKTNFATFEYFDQDFCICVL